MFEGQLGVARLLHLDDQGDTTFGVAERELLADVLLRDFIHDLEVRVLAELDHASPYLHFLVRIVKVDYREREPRIAPQVPDLQTAFARADQDAILLHSNPYGRDVGRAVRHEGCQVCEVRT